MLLKEVPGIGTALDELLAFLDAKGALLLDVGGTHIKDQ
jgi:hypothetical protein